MAKAKKAKKTVKKKADRKRQVRLLEAEILANRMRDFAGEGDELYGLYDLYGAYGLYGMYGAYGLSGAYAFAPKSPVAIQIRPGGQVVIRTSLYRSTPLTVQIWPGGQISVQEHRRRRPQAKRTKKVGKKAAKKTGKKTAKKTAKKKYRNSDNVLEKNEG